MRDDQTDQPIEPSRYSFMNARTSPCVKTQNHMVLVNGWRDDDVARVINVEPASESGKYGGVGTRCDNARPQLGKDLFEQDRLMPIAVIGLALRFPQDATTPELFWQMLLDKQSAMTEMPADRFNFNAFHQPGEHQNGGLNVKGAHFLKEDIGRFDAPFFSMTSAEAECVDPQQRLLLEVAYEAFENAGISIQQARASNTSVYVGSFNHDYETMLSRDPEVQAKYKTTGTESGMLANRLSWFYDLRGPSVSVDTACSSSLVALNLACQSIYSGEATMSLVGGCNLFFNPDILASMTDLGLLSPDGKSYSFDNRANGYSRGEGFAVVLIKPLEAALHDGDTIRAVIRATSMNQDGRTPGITQPNGDAQRALINQTYAKGGLDMRHTRFFEAHGTGTPLGDPIEARAINAAFGSYRSKEEPLYVGAVKANIGHLEGASGLAGLVKTVLALEKGLIPPNALFEKPNTSIPFHEWNIQLALEPTPWPTTSLRRASVSSFGFGGTNVHAVLDDAYNYMRIRNLRGRHTTNPLPSRPSRPTTLVNHSDRVISECSAAKAELQEKRPRLFVWSAFDEHGLERISAAYYETLANQDHTICKTDLLNDLCYTLSEKRGHMPWRGFVVATSEKELLLRLKEGFSKPKRVASSLRLGFVYTGQGAQWPCMGRELLDFPIFRESLLAAEMYFQTLGCPWNLLAELLKLEDHSCLDDPSFAQPVCTAIQIALTDLLFTWGIRPSTVIGHSSGEIAAAYSAGALSRESALRVSYYRGKVIGSLRALPEDPGSMLAVGLPEAEIGFYITQTASLGGHVSIGCFNSPCSITLSGTQRRLHAIQKALEGAGVFARKLKVDVAYHTQQMDRVACDYGHLIEELREGDLQSYKTTVFSSVTGEEISKAKLVQSDYWVSNLVSPVRFFQAVTSAFSGPEEASPSSFLEVGPHSTLKGPLQETLEALKTESKVTYDAVLVRRKSASEKALEAVGRLFCQGYEVLFAAVNRPSNSHVEPRMLTDLPPYPFNHTKRYWLEGRLSRNFRFRKLPHHALLGTPVPDWNTLEARWRAGMRIAEKPWVEDHKVNGIATYPAAGLLVMAIEAANQLADHTGKPHGYRFRDVSIKKALTLSSLDEVETELHLRPSRDAKREFLQWSDFHIYVHEGDECLEICSGSIAIEYEDGSTKERGTTETTQSSIDYRQRYDLGSHRCDRSVQSKGFYEHFEKIGLSYGPSFQGLREIRYNKSGEATAVINLRHWQTYLSENSSHLHISAMHPAALDAIFQTVFPALTEGGTKSVPTMIPTKFRSLWIAVSSSMKSDPMVQVYTTANFTGFRNAESSIVAIKAENSQPCVIGSFEMTFVSGYDRPPVTDTTVNRLCFHIDSRPDPDLLSNPQIASYCSSGDQTVINRSTTLREEQKRLACYLSFVGVMNHRPCGETLKDNAHLGRYFDWMSQQVSKNSKSASICSEREWSSLADDALYIEQLRAKVSNFDPEGKVISIVGGNLCGILDGRVDALALLFDDSTLMQDYYQYCHNNSSALSELQKYVDMLAHKKFLINILEIGAGTGGGTEVVLGSLIRPTMEGGTWTRISQYTYTDISPSFFENAKKKFEYASEKMKFATLNIELDPQQQGFPEAGYDIILASHVLHATKDLQATLRNTRKLLKAGGKLILYETVLPEAILPGFIFGLLSGWWLGSEDNRKWSPLIDESTWHDSLVKSGFSGVDIAFTNPAGGPQLGGSVMIATAIDEECVTAPINLAGNLTHTMSTVIVTTGSLLQNQLAKRLQIEMENLGCRPCSIIDVEEAESYDFNKTRCIFLPEIDQPFLDRMTPSAYVGLQNIISTSQGLLWISTDNQDSPLKKMFLGFARSAREEATALRFVTLLLDASGGFEKHIQKVVRVFETTMLNESEDYEREYAEEDGILAIRRVVEADVINHHVHAQITDQPAEPHVLGKHRKRPFKLEISSPGMLDTLEFVDETQHNLPLPPDEVEIEIKASGLNFRDVLIALGQTTGKSLGGECAGVVTRTGSQTNLQIGDRVVSFVDASFATLGRANVLTTHKIPDDMGYNLAAALPTVFCTAHYALSRWARMKAGESILIHSAAGGFGQATIQLAKLYNVEIFATAGSEEKRQFLTNTYKIPADHLFSSRSYHFADGIKRMTDGRGVDVVINSLAGEALRSSWECVAPFGRFIEVGKKDVYSYGMLPMHQFAKNVTFSCVDLEHIFSTDKSLAGNLLQDVMRLYEAGKIFVPEPLHVFPCSKVEEAFRFMQSGKSKGKIVVEFKDDDTIMAKPASMPTYEFDPQATYLISGGLGGLGRCAAQWMANRNAKYLILLGRNGAQSEAAKSLVESLQSQGVQVAAPPCDVTDRDRVACVLDECSRTMPPIKGCIVSAMVLKDAAFETMRLEDFNIPVKPKVEGTWNLHTLLPKGLDFFILLSSISSITGYAGQTNYASGNAFQDALAHRRVAAGEKAVSINLGVVIDVGYVAEHERAKKVLTERGFVCVRGVDYVALLDYYCNPALPVLSPRECQLVTGLEIPSALSMQGLPEPSWMRDPMFRHLHQIPSDQSTGSGTKGGAAKAVINWETRLRAVNSKVEAESLALEAFVMKASQSLDVEKAAIDVEKPLFMYGYDSLAAVELRSWCRRHFGSDMAVFEILGNESTSHLAKTAAMRSRFVPASLKMAVV